MEDVPQRMNFPGNQARAGSYFPAWLIAVLLVVITISVYWPATRCDFVNFDDPDYVSANPRVQSGLTLGNAGWAVTTGHAFNWHPITWLSLMLDVSLFGSKPAVLHFTNLALHAVNASLIFWLFWRLTAAKWRSAAVARLGRTEAAISEYQEAIRLKPDFADPRNNLGSIFLQQRRLDETISQFQAAIRLAADYAPAHYNLGVAFTKKGQADDAINEFEAAIRLKPDYAIAHNSLGIAYGGKGRIDEAISQFQDAIRFKPAYASAQTNLALALALKNKGPGK